MKWFFEALRKYAVFNGRAGRKEYWYFMLFQIILGLIVMTIDIPDLDNSGYTQIQFGMYEVVTFIPSLAVGIRRMHDINRSGWYILIPVYSLILACENGTPGDNDYGPNPQEDIFYGADDYEKPFNINH